MSSSETSLEPLYVVDTHALIWYLTSNERLGIQASAVFRAAEQGETTLIVSAVVVAELYFANQKYGWFADFTETYQKLREKPYFHFIDFKADDTLDFDRDASVPEMHDRIITGLAKRLDASLITSDSLIKSSNTVKITW